MKYTGGSETKGGFYWKKGKWEIVAVEGKTGTLPGGNREEYIRVHGLLLLPTALVLSVAYVMFLPVMGFAMLFWAIVNKLSGPMRRVLALRPTRHATN
jgi:hypothetical protein